MMLRIASRIGCAAMVVLALVYVGCTASADVEPRMAENPVLRWSRIAVEILPVEAGPILDSRAMAIAHAAMHDAVNGVERRYEPYAADLSGPGASLDAAVARAARDVLLAMAPGQRDRIERDYGEALSGIPEGHPKSLGISLGEQAARQNIERRSADGIVPGPWPPLAGPLAEPPFVPTGKPGDYAFTPPFDAPPLGPVALFPGFGRLGPFVTDLSRHQLRGPDALDSKQYAHDFNTVKSVGSLKSTTRTPDQTASAFFWFENVAIWNNIASAVLQRNGFDPWRTARVLALVNFAMADGTIACFEAKYRFRFWRPYTAIRRAQEDGNPETAPDPEWLPLLWTEPGSPPKFLIPPIPDYPSALAVTSAAAAEVLSRHVGHAERFEVGSPFLPGVTRRFASFDQAATEAGMSRVYGGIHFVNAVQDGFKQGKRIGRDVSRALGRTR